MLEASIASCHHRMIVMSKRIIDVKPLEWWLERHKLLLNVSLYCYYFIPGLWAGMTHTHGLPVGTPSQCPSAYLTLRQLAGSSSFSQSLLGSLMDSWDIQSWRCLWNLPFLGVRAPLCRERVPSTRWQSPSIKW